jgi:hypothetical protein
MSKFSRNFVSRKFSFLRKFSRKWVCFCDKHFQNDKFRRKLTILVHVHYCCPICFEVHAGQYYCPICFEAPSGVDNREVHVHYCCSICCEAPSGFDFLRYFTIFPVSCVRFLIHFRFRENFRENVRYFHNFS